MKILFTILVICMAGMFFSLAYLGNKGIKHYKKVNESRTSCYKKHNRDKASLKKFKLITNRCKEKHAYF